LIVVKYATKNQLKKTKNELADCWIRSIELSLVFVLVCQHLAEKEGKKEKEKEKEKKRNKKGIKKEQKRLIKIH
jgi:hypothetical protein